MNDPLQTRIPPFSVHATVIEHQIPAGDTAIFIVASVIHLTFNKKSPQNKA